MDQILAVFHKIIDALGGGHQHLHADLDAAAAPLPLADPPEFDAAPTPGADEQKAGR